MLVHHPSVATKAKPLQRDEVFGVHERLVRAAEAAGYKFHFLDDDGDRLEAYPSGQDCNPVQRMLLWAIHRVGPARARLRRAQDIERAEEREQAIRNAMLKAQCARAGKTQGLERCLGSLRRGAPPPSPDLCEVLETSCIRRQSEAELTWQRPAVPRTVNVEVLVPTLDDRLRDKGLEKARSALSELLAAVGYLDRHASNVEHAMRVLRHDEIPERTAAEQFEQMAQQLREVLDQTDRFDGFPDIRNASDWEAALSDIGVGMRSVGCSGRDVARLLRGNDDPDGIAAVENKVSRRRRLVT
jgi:hypothetical protein